MPISVSFPPWLTQWMREHGIALWGAADLREFSTPVDETGRGFPAALSWAVPMDPRIMAGIQQGPTRVYADAYVAANAAINETGEQLAAEVKRHGHRARALRASDRTDPVNIRADFPHKTAATRAGLGWIGRHDQVITRPYGPWVRLGTVFTDMELPCGPPAERGFCGRCTRCVEACPAGALKGAAWRPGLPREDILDVEACDRWKIEHYFMYESGHTCGICTSVCPHGLKTLKNSPEDP